MNDSDNPEFWVFRRPDGHAITSARTDTYDSERMLQEEVWDPDKPRPEGAWSTETRTQWTAFTRECLRGRCAHVKAGKPASTEETWQAAMARMIPMLESVKAQMIAVWDEVKPAVVALRDTLHTIRVDGDHAGLCASGRYGRCFCACRACTNSEGACACVHCDHEATS